MPTITVPRTDLSTEELVTVLRDGLWSAPATTGVQAQVTITSPGGQTKLRIHPSGITVTLVLTPSASSARSARCWRAGRA
jgi:hypothetical protein